MGADDKHVLLFAILEKENYKEGKGYSYKTCIYITWHRQSVCYYGEYYFATTSGIQTKRVNSCF